MYILVIKSFVLTLSLVTYEGIPPIESCDSWVIWSRDIRKSWISSSTRTMASSHRVMWLIYNEITWYLKKNWISTLATPVTIKLNRGVSYEFRQFGFETNLVLGLSMILSLSERKKLYRLWNKCILGKLW